jgi:hypothetical protein
VRLAPDWNRLVTARRLILALLAFVSVSTVPAPPALGATRYDPRLQFRVVRTPHFTIYWHQGEETEAARLAVIAEQVRTELEPDLGTIAARIHVILVDQSDLSNGWATPVPWDAIELTARPPALASSIGNTTDWLRLVFTHEYTHILHLDRSRGLMRGIRRVFGRVPIAFPNTFLPQWQVEGIATFEESRQTGEGRVRSGDFRTIVDEAARTGRFEPSDRVSGGLDDWPSGNGAYAYGSFFHQYLADRFGARSIADLRDATSGRVPYFGAGAFKKVFGESLNDLWRDFGASRSGVPAHSATDEAATRLTHHGFEVTGLTASSGDLFYAVSTPDGYPSLMRLTPGRAPVRIAWRFAGDRTAAGGDWVVFDQVAPVRSVAWYSDLYAVKLDGGAVHRLTYEARAAEPAFSPDGKRIACVVEQGGRRALAIIPFEPDRVTQPEILLDRADSDFGGPQWSPDGRRLIAERRHDGRYEIVEIDVASRDLRTLLASHARLATPAWVDDASIIFSAELPGAASNVFALDVGTKAVKRVTDSVTGARFPRMSPDRRSLFYVGYTADGSDIFSVAVNDNAWPPVESQDFDTSTTVHDSPAAPEPPLPASDAYTPWPTLPPTYWTPIVYTDAGELNAGAGTAMSDVLGRHAYGAQAAWGARARPDWSISYAYDRWRPTLFASYSDDTDPVRGGEIRSRQVQGGAVLPFRRLRRTETLFGAIDFERDGLTCAGPCRTRATSSRRAAVQAGWWHDTRRLFGYSISPEEGHSISGSFESTVTGLGSDVDGQAAVLDARAFHRLGGPHTVLAVRGAAAIAWGALDDRRVFSAGGSGPAAAVFAFDRDAIGLLRGFGPDAVVGTRAVVANVDLRFPIVRPERGAGVFPLFVRSIHGAVFADTGSAWDAAFRGSDLRTAGGGELSIDLVLGHYLPITFAAGAAWVHDPVASRNGAAGFARIGRAF